MRVVTESPQVQLAVTAACRATGFRRHVLPNTLSGGALDSECVSWIADACERAGLAVYRGRHAVSVSAGSADVAAAWRAARADVRRFHGELYRLA